MPIPLTNCRDNRLKALFAALPSLELDELRELLRLGDLVATAGGTAPLQVLADQPVRVGHARLYLPTLAATDWMLKRRDWFTTDAERWLWDGYCLAHGRRPAILGRLLTARQAQHAVSAWRDTLGVTLAELQSAVLACLEGFPQATRIARLDQAPTDVLAWAAAYMQTYGERCDQWLWSEPLQRLVWLDRAAAQALAPKDEPPPGKLAAMRAYADYEQQLRQKYLDPRPSTLDPGEPQL